VLAGLILVLALLRAGRPRETDPYWQIREGRELLAGQPLVHADSWSWAPVDATVYPNSPGWNVLLALAYDHLGWPGFLLLSTASIALALALVAVASRRLGASRGTTALALLLTFALTAPFLSARAALPAFALLLGGVLVGDRLARDRTRLLYYALVGFAFAFVGNWLHTSWGMLAIALAVAWSILWLHRQRDAWLRWLLATAGLALGLLMGPYGLEVFRISRSVYGIANDLLIEWASIWIIPDRLYWIPATLLTIGVAILALAPLARRFAGKAALNHDQRLVAVLAGLALTFAIAGQWVSRFAMIAGLFIGPVIARHLTRVATRTTTPSGIAERLGDRYLGIVITGVVVALALPALLFASNLGRPQLADAVAYLPERCRLFASDAGAPLLLRPDVQVWMDGRADYWGRQRLADFTAYFAVAMPDPVPPGTTCVLIARDPAFEPLATRLRSDGEWREVSVPKAWLWVRR
jgi:hypothetical protein